MSFENDDPRMREFTPLPPRAPRSEAIPAAGAPLQGPGMRPEDAAAEARQQPRKPKGEPVVVASFWVKLRMFLGAIIGPRVDADEWRKRYSVCANCKDVVVVNKRFKEKLYCGKCDCWQWWFARLDHKCRYELHKCPKGRHPGQAGPRKTCAGCGG